jgi:hypothetical protein
MIRILNNLLTTLHVKGIIIIHNTLKQEWEKILYKETYKKKDILIIIIDQIIITRFLAITKIIFQQYLVLIKPNVMCQGRVIIIIWNKEGFQKTRELLPFMINNLIITKILGNNHLFVIVISQFRLVFIVNKKTISDKILWWQLKIN